MYIMMYLGVIKEDARMAQMIRKQVYIQPRQQGILKRLARMHGVTEAEIVRRAIDREASTESVHAGWFDPTAWEEARAFILSFFARGPVRGRRTWKREDAYEERSNRYGR
jgi:hypothetical protein